MERSYFVPKNGDVAYLSIPKSGCSSIKMALAESRNLGDFDPAQSVHNIEDHNFLFMSVVGENALCLRSLYKFSFVRDPLERVYSFYRNKVKVFDPYVTPYYSKFGIDAGDSIDEFIDKLVGVPHEMLEDHLYPQANIVFDEDAILVDWLGRLENIKSDWKVLSSLFGLSENIGTENKTDKSAFEPPSYGRREKLKNYYKNDCFLFMECEFEEVSESLLKKKEVLKKIGFDLPLKIDRFQHSGDVKYDMYLECLHREVSHLRRQLKGANSSLLMVNEKLDNLIDGRTGLERRSLYKSRFFNFFGRK